MGFGYEVSCKGCGYCPQVSAIRRGSRWYICRRCESLVSAEYPLHRLDSPNCPQCATRLSQDRLAHNFYVRVEGDDDNIHLPCPRCGHRFLTFKCNVHISFMAPPTPKPGDVVHAIAHDGGKRIIMEGMMYSNIRSINPVAVPDETPVELKVLSVKETDFRSDIEVEFLRELSWATL